MTRAAYILHAPANSAAPDGRAITQVSITAASSSRQRRLRSTSQAGASGVPSPAGPNLFTAAWERAKHRYLYAPHGTKRQRWRELHKLTNEALRG